MEKRNFIYACMLFTFMMISCSKVKDSQMMVLRDCTGTYLKHEGKDYHVCNVETLQIYPDSAIITATFRPLSACPGADKDVVCALYHANEGWVKVTSVE